MKASRRAGCAILGAALLLGSILSAVPVQAETPSLSVPGYAPAERTAPLVKPLWTASIDVPGADGFFYEGNAAAQNGIVYAISGSKLVARSAVDGKILFSYGEDLRPFVKLASDLAFVVHKDGRIAALSASTGKRKWISQAGMQADGGTPFIGKDRIYALNDNGLTALRASDGKRLWTDVKELMGTGPYSLSEHDGVLLLTYVVSGAITFTQLNAVDMATGKLLWKAHGTGAPLLVQDGLVYTVKEMWMLADMDRTPKRQVEMPVLNLRSGAVKGTRLYDYEMEGALPYPIRSPILALDKNVLYVDGGGTQLFKFAFDAYEAGAKPVQTYFKRNERMQLAGPPLVGRILLVSQDNGGLYGIKTANGQPVTWLADNPVVRSDIYGNGIFSAQSDGYLYEFDLHTTEPLLKVATGSREYGPTLKTGHMLIVQTKGKLIAVKLPR
ncbi:PQQ-binding-like beta-propeller repeat protein [Paenibacillus albicereus]|uniref:PQQ-binding-like beta-propeller repeat protein n=1 Tax=Paenibacillus albicereus TaxID=2726185 RepID=A0A6H2GU27_9BACL|nr:PQQ-binding-like beta-propeller repeat protein [Paenibacillus albicereus]QJC50892.1 PQQ-binding-like beta-propeller repeat protein [Paenibacillus albicereus]